MKPGVILVVFKLQMVGHRFSVPGRNQNIKACPGDGTPLTDATRFGPEKHIGFKPQAPYQPLVFRKIALPERILIRQARKQVNRVLFRFRRVFLLKKTDILVDNGFHHIAVGLEIRRLEARCFHRYNRPALFGEFLNQAVHIITHNACRAPGKDNLQIGIQHLVGVADNLPQPVDAAKDNLFFRKVGARRGAAARVARAAFKKALYHIAAAGSGVEDRYGLRNGDDALQSADGAGVASLFNNACFAHLPASPCKK